MTEKRRYPRMSVNLPLVLRHGGRLIPATALNVSCGGMYIKADEGVITGKAPVEIIFDLDEGNRDLSLRGQVTRVDVSKEGIGVQFTNLFSVGHKAIQEYIRKNLN